MRTRSPLSALSDALSGGKNWTGVIAGERLPAFWFAVRTPEGCQMVAGVSPRVWGRPPDSRRVDHRRRRRRTDCRYRTIAATPPASGCGWRRFPVVASAGDTPATICDASGVDSPLLVEQLLHDFRDL